jgi:ATP synthase protein I
MSRSRNAGDSGRDGGSRPTVESSASSTAGLAGMGVQFVVAILLCLFAGKWLDARLGTAPWLLILGVFLGAGASIVAMYRRAFPPDKQGSAGPPGSPRP